jgi:nicotinamide riboside kinase
MSFGPEYCENGAIVYFGAITGTHSAGKTTLLDGLINYSTAIDELPDAPKTIPYPKFRRLDGVAVAFVPEATTAYMHHTGLNTLATTDYSREHQVAMEEYGLSLIMSGFTELAEYLAFTKEKHGLILTDRTPLDGPVYRTKRLPGDDPWVSGFINETLLHGRTFNTFEDVQLNKENMWSDFLKRYCDFVIIPDHTEIALEDNGTRLLDETFRQEIADKMKEIYIKSVGLEKIHVVQGSHSERLRSTQTVINDTLSPQLIV